jgi:hypothetical protein
VASSALSAFIDAKLLLLSVKPTPPTTIQLLPLRELRVMHRQHGLFLFHFYFRRCQHMDRGSPANFETFLQFFFVVMM